MILPDISLELFLGRTRRHDSISHLKRNDRAPSAFFSNYKNTKKKTNKFNTPYRRRRCPLRSGASATHNSNRGVVASGIWVERKLTSFDHIPRIPLGTHSSSRSSPYSSRSSGFASSVVGDAFDGDVPLPSLPQLPPSPVCFSPSGMYLFSGGHPSGALLMWQFDASTGQVTKLFGNDVGIEEGSLFSRFPSDSDRIAVD